MAYRLLLAGDNNLWSDSATKILTPEYLVGRAENAARAVEVVAENASDLVILDCGKSPTDGLAWLRAIRHTAGGQQMPVIAVSAKRTDDLVAQAFEWGADDFILEDVDPSELLARVRSVLRRRFEREATLGSAITLGTISVDPSRHSCLVRGAPIRLNPREFELLELLMRKAGRVLTRAYLLETLWGMSRFADTRTVDVSISRLRKALGARAARWIETVERYGYRFQDPKVLGR